MTLEGLAACPVKVTRERDNLDGWPCFYPMQHLTHEPNASHRAKLKAWAALQHGKPSLKA